MSARTRPPGQMQEECPRVTVGMIVLGSRPKTDGEVSQIGVGRVGPPNLRIEKHILAKPSLGSLKRCTVVSRVRFVHACSSSIDGNWTPVRQSYRRGLSSE